MTDDSNPALSSAAREARNADKIKTPPDSWEVLYDPKYDGKITTVTFFLAGSDATTLPLWILGSPRKTQQLPEVNAVAAVILVVSLPLIAVAAYLMRDEGAGTRIAQGE